MRLSKQNHLTKFLSDTIAKGKLAKKQILKIYKLNTFSIEFINIQSIESYFEYS